MIGIITLITNAWEMAVHQACTFPEGTGRVATAEAAQKGSQGTADPVPHYCSWFEFHLDSHKNTFLVASPSCFSQIVTAHIKYNSIAIFLLQNNCFQMGNGPLNSIVNRRRVVMENMIFELAFCVVLGSEEEHLCIAWSLCDYVMVGRVY